MAKARQQLQLRNWKLICSHNEPNIAGQLSKKLTDPRRQRTWSGKKDMNKPKTLSAERGADSGAAPCSALTSRHLEIKQLEIAIAKTKAAQIRADQTLDALHNKLMGQIAELRFQKLMARMDTPNKL